MIDNRLRFRLITIASDEELNEAARFCESVLADQSVSVPDGVVLDVGVIRNQGWAVLECNAAFAAGIYGCNPVAVLPVLRRACKPVSESTQPGA